MNKRKRTLSALALSLALALGLTACGGGGMTAADATDYVQGLMDKTYLGKFNKSYLEGVDITEEVAQQDYEDGLEVEYEYFASAFEFDTDYVTDELHQEVVDLLGDIYQSSKYQVKEATKVDDGYAVEVVVEPIDIIPLVAENYLEDFADEFAARYADVDQAALEAMTPEEQEAFWLTYESDWVSGIVALFREHLSELGHLDAESIMVQFKPDEEGYYSISDTDFSNIDALVLAYSY